MSHILLNVVWQYNLLGLAWSKTNCGYVCTCWNTCHCGLQIIWPYIISCHCGLKIIWSYIISWIISVWVIQSRVKPASLSANPGKERRPGGYQTTTAWGIQAWCGLLKQADCKAPNRIVRDTQFQQIWPANRHLAHLPLVYRSVICGWAKKVTRWLIEICFYTDVAFSLIRRFIEWKCACSLVISS